jgi:hypothetical protein
MEVVEGELVIHNVDMDIRLGTAVPIYFNDPDRACTVLNKDGEDIATIPSTVPRPLTKAAAVIANYEAYYGYPGLRRRAEGRPDTHRIEWLLGRF